MVTTYIFLGKANIDGVVDWKTKRITSKRRVSWLKKRRRNVVVKLKKMVAIVAVSVQKGNTYLM